VRLAKLGYFATAPELFAREGDVNTMTDLQTILDTVTAKILA
jgi:carboxymethylenebutenolidase